MVRIENISNDDLLNINLIFEDNGKKILGEVEEVEGNQIKVNFLGEFVDDKFNSGIIRRLTLIRLLE